MAIVSGIGATLEAAETTGRVDEHWFGEAASTIVVACEPSLVARISSRASSAGIAFRTLGVVGGEEIRFNGTAARVSLSRAASVYDLGLAAFA
jgi:hypothetical protein